MAEPLSIWMTLIPVIVGGIIGLAGGLAGPPLVHWLNEKANRKKRKAEKLEELIGQLNEHEYWLGEVRSIRVFGTAGVEGPNPLSKAKAVAAVHFPNFDALLDDLGLTAMQYEQWMFSRAKRRLAGENDKLNEGFEAAYKDYAYKLSSVMNELKEFAKTEFEES